MQTLSKFENWFRVQRVACAILMCSCAGMVAAQATLPSFADRREVAPVLAEARVLAEELEAGIAEGFHVPSGWECEAARRPEPYNSVALNTVPLVSRVCRKGAQELNVYLTLDPSTAEGSCRSVEHTKDEIARGRAKPDLFAFFETGRWRIKRSVLDLEGCAGGQLALTVRGHRSNAALAAGPALVDEFARAMLQIDVGDLAISDTFARHQLAVERAVGMLATQASALEAMLPARSSDILRVPMRPRGSVPESLPAELRDGPSVSATLETGGCKLMIFLGASKARILKVQSKMGHGRAQEGKTARSFTPTSSAIQIGLWDVSVWTAQGSM